MTQIARDFFSKTSGIGSLPHHNVDAAIEHSFQYGIPFLPQIPIRNPWEFMIPQALDGLPGLIVEKDGAAVLDYAVWRGRETNFNFRLQLAFERATSDEWAFEGFEPNASTASCYQPFLWELAERKSTVAKVQIAGPLTLQWALRLRDQTPALEWPDVCSQIFKLVTARAIAMVRRLRYSQIKPLIYLDEPGLYAFDASSHKSEVALRELKLVIDALKKEQAIVGLHCCSNTDWPRIFELGTHFISIDTELSLKAVLSQNEALERYVQRGGRFSFGVIPTMHEFGDFNELIEKFRTVFSPFQKEKPALARQLLQESVFSPACGLALHSTEAAEMVLSALHSVRARLLEF